MSIVIDKDKCKKCRLCLDVCPGNLLWADEDNKAYIRYPYECWGCTACLKECPFGAIKYYIGADAGGIGGTIYITKQKEKTIWHIDTPIEESVEIITDSRESNRY